MSTNGLARPAKKPVIPHVHHARDLANSASGPRPFARKPPANRPPRSPAIGKITAGRRIPRQRPAMWSIHGDSPDRGGKTNGV